MAIKIKVKNLETGDKEVFEAGEEDTMADVLEAMGLDKEKYEIANGMTGRHVDKNKPFGEIDKTEFAIAKK